MQYQTIKDIQDRVLADSLTFVTTSDEDRLIKGLSKLNKPIGRKMFFWSSSIGLHLVDYKTPRMDYFSTGRYTINSSIKSKQDICIITGKDILDEITIKSIQNRKLGSDFEESCYVLLDFCTEIYKDSLFRKLKDTAKIASIGSISIIVTSTGSYSSEILNNISFHANLSTPSGEEIEDILLSIGEQIKEHNKISPTNIIDPTYNEIEVVKALLNLSENDILDILQLSMISHNNIQHESIEKIKTLWNIRENV